MRLNAILTPKPGNQLWGIYYTDREYAREHGAPLRTVIEAPTKLSAEEEAARLGFSDPLAHPVTPDQVSQAQWLPMRRGGHRQELVRKSSRCIRV
jgi:hypothetical protein